MENNSKKRPYRQLIWKIWLRTLLLLFFAVFFVMLVRTVGQGKLGNAAVYILTNLFSVPQADALHIYAMYIRPNLAYILFVAMLIFFSILFWILLSWLMRYFDEVAEGVKRLADGEKSPIALSPELGFMEIQLNQVQTELEKSRQTELHAEKRKNDLILYLAHDIKTPLTSVIGYLNLLYDAPDLSAEQRRKYVEITLKKAERLDRLVNEFFEITRYHLQTVPPKKERLDLSYMLIQIIDEAYPLFAAKRQTVSTHLPDGLEIFADADQLARVFHNLLKNAVSYSAAGTELTVSAEKQDNNAVLRFENAGVIPSEALDRIFEKFYRADPSRQSDTGGFGLGLAISKDIIELHHGQISAACTDNRTVFTVILPVCPL